MIDGIDVLKQFREGLLEQVGTKTGWGKEELKVLITEVYTEVLEQVIGTEKKDG